MASTKSGNSSSSSSNNKKETRNICEYIGVAPDSGCKVAFDLDSVDYTPDIAYSVKYIIEVPENTHKVLRTFPGPFSFGQQPTPLQHAAMWTVNHAAAQRLLETVPFKCYNCNTKATEFCFHGLVTPSLDPRTHEMTLIVMNTEARPYCNACETIVAQGMRGDHAATVAANRATGLGLGGRRQANAGGTADDDGTNSKTCAFCERRGAGTKRCGRCKVTYYCNRQCQVFHWKKGGHKQQCQKASEEA